MVLQFRDFLKKLNNELPEGWRLDKCRHKILDGYFTISFEYSGAPYNYYIHAIPENMYYVAEPEELINDIINILKYTSEFKNE